MTHKYKLKRDRIFDTEIVKVFESDEKSSKVEDAIYQEILQTKDNHGTWTLYVWLEDASIWFDILLVWR